MCAHEILEEINGVGFCISCGIETDATVPPCREYFYKKVSRCAPFMEKKPTREQRMFSKVNELGYEKKVADMTVKIYLAFFHKSEKKNFKMKKSVLLACVSHAHSVLNVPFNQEKEREKIGITKREAQKGTKDLKTTLQICC